MEWIGILFSVASLGLSVWALVKAYRLEQRYILISRVPELTAELARVAEPLLAYLKEPSSQQMKEEIISEVDVGQSVLNRLIKKLEKNDKLDFRRFQYELKQTLEHNNISESDLWEAYRVFRRAVASAEDLIQTKTLSRSHERKGTLHRYRRETDAADKERKSQMASTGGRDSASAQSSLYCLFSQL